MTHIVLNLKNALLRKLPTDEEIGSREPKVISKILDITARYARQEWWTVRRDAKRSHRHDRF